MIAAEDSTAAGNHSAAVVPHGALRVLVALSKPELKPPAADSRGLIICSTATGVK